MTKVTSLTAAIMAAVCIGSSAVSLAQVEVVESRNRLLTSSDNSNDKPHPTAAGQADLFYQLQTLQQEVLELRGLLEEQAYELKRLKQQRLDDYVGFDRRLSALNGATAESSSSAPSLSSDNKPSSASLSASVNPDQPQPDEVESYRAAIDLVLRKKDYVQAIAGFEAYLRNFPGGRYVPNSQYWLGEIFLLQGNLEQARNWFSRLLDDHSEHAKAPDAAYKLGTVYHKLGNQVKARQLLQQVAGGDSNAARLATSYLANEMKQ